MKVSSFILLASIAAGPAAAQVPVTQVGPYNNGHVPAYIGTGQGGAMLIDPGPAGGGGTGVSEMALVAPLSPTGPIGTNFCNYDALLTNPAGYHYLCFSPNAIVYGAGGGATQLPLVFNINGVQTTLSGIIPSLTIGSTAISGGSSGQLLYNNAGILGGTTVPTIGGVKITGSATPYRPTDVPGPFSGVFLASTSAGLDLCNQYLANCGITWPLLTVSGLTLLGMTTQNDATNQENNFNVLMYNNKGQINAWANSTSYATGALVNNLAYSYIQRNPLCTSAESPATGPSGPTNGQVEGSPPCSWDVIAPTVLTVKNNASFQTKMQPGGGSGWNIAAGLQVQSGWSSQAAVNMEIDAVNSTSIDPTLLQPVRINDIYMGGVAGANPITTMLLVSPIGRIGVYGAHEGVYVNGLYSIQDHAFHDNSGAQISYWDEGVHSLASIDLASAAPVGLLVAAAGVYTDAVKIQTGSSAAVHDVSSSLIGYWDQGTHATASMSLAGTAPVGLIVPAAGTYTNGIEVQSGSAHAIWVNDAATTGYLDDAAHSASNMVLSGAVATGINFTGTYSGAAIAIPSGATIGLNGTSNTISYNGSQIVLSGAAKTTGALTVTGNSTTTGQVQSQAEFISTSTNAPTITGSCTSITLTKGYAAGKLLAGAACASGTIILTFGVADPTQGRACFAADVTTTTATLKQAAAPAGTLTLNATGVANGDVLIYGCFGIN